MTPPASRIATLDLIRGVAVMGILAANIAAFGFPAFAYLSPAALGPPSRPDLIAWTANFILVEGKMRGLFSFLFGASMLLVIDGAQAAGDDPAAVHYRRMMWLFLFGVAHFYLLWWGDILTLYAEVGAIAFLFHRLPVRALVTLGLMFVAIEMIQIMALATYAFQAHAAAVRPGATATAIADWRYYAAGFGQPDAATVTRELAIGRGGYGDLVAYRWAQDETPFTALGQVGAETLGYMLLGMAALRSGFLTGAWSRARYGRIVAVTLGIGWPLYALMAWFEIAHGFDARSMTLASMVFATPVRPFVFAGYAALIILLARPGGWLTTLIAAAGRMAFSNYLGTTAVCTTLFYGYGFGLYGHVARAQLYLVVLAVWIVMLAWSKPWLDRFRYGPLEWLWRSLARFAWQPMHGPANASR